MQKKPANMIAAWAEQAPAMRGFSLYNHVQFFTLPQFPSGYDVDTNSPIIPVMFP